MELLSAPTETGVRSSSLQTSSTGSLFAVFGLMTSEAASLAIA